MKIFVKTLKGTSFELEVKPEDTVVDVKKQIETVQGSDVYPAAQQMLIYQGKVLKDDATLEEHKVAENSFVVVMLNKNKRLPSDCSIALPAPTKEHQSSAPTPAPPPATAPQTAAPTSTQLASVSATAAPVSSVSAVSETGVYGEAASNLVAGNNLEGAIQQILDVGGGTWDRDTVVRALQAAYNNPERAVEYLYSGIPEQAEIPPVARAPGTGQAANSPTQMPQPTRPAPVTSSGPNANPLDLFPQGLPDVGSVAAGTGSLDFLRNSPQFQVLRAMAQAHPHLLQSMLQELGEKNPHLVRLIQEHQADFLRLLNEPVQRGEGNLGDQLAEAMPQAIQVTPEEREAIGRLEEMGFDPAIVLEVYFACNRNEELAANYLLDHRHELED